MPRHEDTPARRIVVGVDGSPAGEQALRWATAEAAARGGEVEAVAVRERDDLLPGTSFTFQPHGRKAVQDEEGARQYLHGTVLAVAGDMPVIESVRTGDPSTELIKASATADLLVVGSHRHGAMATVLLGSTSAACVRDARCPVVIVPAGLTG